MQEKNLAKNIGRGSLFMSSSDILSSFLEFLLVILLIRTLEVSEFGIFNLALGIILLFHGFSSFGFETAAIRHISIARGSSENKKERAIVCSVFILKTIVALVLSTILFFSRNHLATVVYKTPAISGLLTIGVGIVFFMTMYSTLTMLFHAYKQMFFLSLVNLITVFLRLSLVFLFLSFYASATYALYAYLLSQALVVSMLALYVQRVLPKDLGAKSFDVPMLRLIVVSGFTYYLINLAKLIFERGGILFLGYVAAAEILAYYAFAYKFSMLIPMISSGACMVLLPYISEFVGMKNRTNIQDALNLGLKYFSIMIFPVSAFMLLSGRYLILLLGKSTYLPALPLLNILIIAAAIRGIGRLFSAVLTATEEPKNIILINHSLSISYLVLIVALYPIVGYFSVAYGAILAFSLQKLFEVRRLYVRGYTLPLMRVLKPAAISLFSYLLTDMVIPAINSIPNFLLAGLLFSASYLISLFLIGGFSREDLSFVSYNLLGKRL